MKSLIVILSSTLLFGELINPENGSDLKSVHIRFEWEQEPDAVSYNLQVLRDDFFNTTILDIVEESTVYIEKDIIDWNSDYQWKVRPMYSSGEFGDWIGTSSFSTQQSILTDLDVDIYDDEFIGDELFMYSQFAPYFAVGVVDRFGNEIWNTQIAYMNHINEYGQVYGVNGQGVQFNYNHEILWETPEGTEIDSHEVKQIPNGNYMAFVPIYQQGPIPQGDWTFYFQAVGYSANGIANEFPWMGLRIVEFDQETSEEVWSWDPFEHFSMEDSDLYGGSWWAAYFNGFFDWMHSNAFHFDDEESVIYVSHRHLSRISKIAYPSGEVIWNMGMEEQYNTGSDNICTDLGFSFQHHIQMLDNGDLLFFDNGNLSNILLGDSNPTTRIRKIRVIDDSYCETVWQYDLPQNLHGMGMGSVQLLNNGNYSIYTFGNGLDQGECSMLEVTPDGEMVWKATSEDPSAAWYRSYQIPSIHPDAFSVLVDGYTSNNNENIIEALGGVLDFTIHNKSGYAQPYKYIVSDLIDGGSPMFNYQEEEISLGPYESMNISLFANEGIDASVISLAVLPTYHDYGVKEFMFQVERNSSLAGDLNNDEAINVLDVVLAVNIALSGEYNQFADMNQDDSVDILDIVQIINIIITL